MKVVRKFVPMVVLLLVLTLLLGPAAAAGRPPKGEARDVVFSGDIEGQGELTVESQRDGATIYGPSEGYITLAFLDESHQCKLRITLKRGDATVYIDYDWVDNEEVGAWVPQNHLEGFGTYVDDWQTYQIGLDETTIYDVIPKIRGKKGGYGLEFTNPTQIGEADFNMTIGE